MYFRLPEAGGRYGNPPPIRCPSSVWGRCAQTAAKRLRDTLMHFKSWEDEGKFVFLMLLFTFHFTFAISDLKNNKTKSIYVVSWKRVHVCFHCFSFAVLISIILLNVQRPESHMGKKDQCECNLRKWFKELGWDNEIIILASSLGNSCGCDIVLETTYGKHASCSAFWQSDSQVSIDLRSVVWVHHWTAENSS